MVFGGSQDEELLKEEQALANRNVLFMKHNNRKVLY
jgi:hypothetical protein